MKFKKDNDSRYIVKFMRATERLIGQLTVKEFIAYLAENAEFEGETYEYIDGHLAKCKAYDLTEENSKLHKEFLVTKDGRVFYWLSLREKVELVDEDGLFFCPKGSINRSTNSSERCKKSRANRTQRATYQNIRNKNKFIDVVHHGDGHYYAIQFMKYETPGRTVVNYVGTRCGRKQKFRIRKGTLLSILEDYRKVEV